MLGSLIHSKFLFSICKWFPGINLMFLCHGNTILHKLLLSNAFAGHEIWIIALNFVIWSLLNRLWWVFVSSGKIQYQKRVYYGQPIVNSSNINQMPILHSIQHMFPETHWVSRCLSPVLPVCYLLCLVYTWKSNGYGRSTLIWLRFLSIAPPPHWLEKQCYLLITPSCDNNASWRYFS